MKNKSGKVCKACPRCSKIMTSSALSKHLKQAHGEEIAREESAAAGSAAGFFARLVSKQAARPEEQQPEKQLDDDEPPLEKPLTSIGALASSITEFIGSKINEVINQISFLPTLKDMRKAIKEEVTEAITKALSSAESRPSAAPACKEPAELRQITTAEALAGYYGLRISPVSCALQRLSCTAARTRAQRSATGALPLCTPRAATITAAMRARTAPSSKARSSSATSKRNRDLVSGPAKLVHCRAAARASLSGLARSSSTGT